MSVEVVRFEDKLAAFADLWSPRIVAQMNDYHFKLAKVRGEFEWHRHPDTDEVFIVLRGQMRIAFRDGSVDLAAGEMCVVPKGMEHKPSADDECHIMLVEPTGTLNTGDRDVRGTEGTWV